MIGDPAQRDGEAEDRGTRPSTFDSDYRGDTRHARETSITNHISTEDEANDAKEPANVVNTQDANRARDLGAIAQLEEALNQLDTTSTSDLGAVLPRMFAMTMGILDEVMPDEDERRRWQDQLRSVSSTNFEGSSGSCEQGEQGNKPQAEKTATCSRTVEIAAVPGQSVSVKNKHATSTGPKNPDSGKRCIGCKAVLSDDARDCVHHCGEAYCSAGCKREHRRAHESDCATLVRKSVLKRLGLPSDFDELF